MEWYWVVAIIVAFFAVIGGLIYLFKRGIMSKKELNLIDSMIDVFENVLVLFCQYFLLIFYCF